MASALSQAFSEIAGLQLALARAAKDAKVSHLPVNPLSCSTRELQVLELLADGATKPEVAVQLGLSVNTVQTHMKRLRSRWSARSTAHLVAMAKDAGMLRIQ